MTRRLSTRSLALIAFGLTVASVLCCVQWVSRDCWRIRQWELDTLALESKQEDLEEQVLNLTALLMKSSEEPPRSRRFEPPDTPHTKECYGFLDSSPTLFRTLETARSNMARMWYYEQVRKRYFNGSGARMEKVQ